MRNSTEVRRLFEQEAVLFETADGVPDFRAAQLFGEDAVIFARRMDGSIGGYGIGHYTAYYLTKKGFCTAATYANVKELEQMEKAAGSPPWKECETVKNCTGANEKEKKA